MQFGLWLVTLIEGESTNPYNMTIHWKSIATHDKDYWQSKKLLPELKELNDWHRSVSLSFGSCHIGHTHTWLKYAWMNFKWEKNEWWTL